MPTGDGFASMTLEAGGRLGHYRILGLLGRGGMAAVYRAEDERLEREVALKVLPPEFAWDPDRVERFEREVRAAAKLTHPNIVTVHEFGRDGDQPFYTMALMRGGDLKARIRAHPEGMPPEEAREIALAVARALAYAHGEGFVHRDVKPENILFGQDGAPQLTDFGIARAMSSGTRMTATGMSIGSPHYMSPEQARGQAVDGRSDLYSLGVVLYEMLTGRVPFDAADTLAVAYSHVNDPVPLLPGHLADWQPLLNRLLAKSPADRYGSAGELADVLVTGALPQVSETRAGDVLERPLAPPGTRVISRAREVGSTAGAKEFVPGGAAEAGSPRRGLLAVAAGGVLALAVVGILYVTSREDPDRLSSGDSGGNAGAGTGRSANSSPPVGSNDRNRRDGATETPVSRLAASEEQALGLDRAAREEVQAGLMVSGFDPGEADGVFSARTRAALREWQGVRGRPTTGYLDAESAAVLRAAGEAEELRREAAARREAEREAAARREAEREAAARREAEREAAVRQEAEREAAARREAEREAAARREAEREAAVDPLAGASRVFDGMEFVWIPPGEFRMGSTSSEADDERPVTRVRITRGYWLGKYEVTQSEWESVIGSNPSGFSDCGGNCPVEMVSWADVQGFIGRLNARAGREVYRLPTEAEWEYAARAGTAGDRYGSLDAIAWWRDNSGRRTHPVGGKSANGWGLYDMLGNVWEWVQDWYGASYPGGTVTDPRGPGSGSSRVLRGGSWFIDARYARASIRIRHDPGNRSGHLGFRLLRTTR